MLLFAWIVVFIFQQSSRFLQMDAAAVLSDLNVYNPAAHLNKQPPTL